MNVKIEQQITECGSATSALAAYDFKRGQVAIIVAVVGVIVKEPTILWMQVTFYSILIM